MKKPLLAIGAFLIMALIIVSLLLQTRKLSTIPPHGQDPTLRALYDTVLKLKSEVASLKAGAPGLGDYMNQMSLHIAKIWTESEQKNWRLMAYDAKELNEAMECAEMTDDTVGVENVKVNGVIQSLRNSLIPPLIDAIQKEDLFAFTGAYNKLLAACNDCHRVSNHDFIYMTYPHGDPVVNQYWRVLK